MNLYDEERLSAVGVSDRKTTHEDRMTECVTCQGSGRVLRWRYRQRCLQVNTGEFRLFDKVHALQRLLENAVQQRDFRFEDDMLLIEDELLGGDGWILFDSYSASCPVCGGKGRI